MGRASEIAERLARHAEAVCKQYLPHGRRSGAYWIAGDVAGGKGRSLHVQLTGEWAGQWKDENPACGGDYGDLLDLIRCVCGFANMLEAIDEAERFLGDNPSPPPEPGFSLGDSEPDDTESKRGKARKLFDHARPIGGTRAETYLRARGLDLSHLSVLRYHPKVFHKEEDGIVRYGPAFIAKITDPPGNFVGVQRTWFRFEDGEPHAYLRKMLGYPRDGAVDLGGNAPLVVAGEGIETVASVFGAFPTARFRSLLTATRLEAFAPPPDAAALIILVDRDIAGLHAGRAHRVRCQAAGLPCRLLLPRSKEYGADWNDDLRRFGPVATFEYARSQALGLPLAA